MPSIGIIGAGVAGLHLGLYLQRQGIEATLYTEQSPDEMRAGRLLNTVALQAAALTRDRELGVEHWSQPEHLTGILHLHVAVESPIVVRGSLAEPLLFVDMRMYLPRLLEDFAARGGEVVQRALDPDGVARLAAAHDLIVVATGRAGLADMFPRDPARSPYTAPQRRLWAGLVRGVTPSGRSELPYHLVPGHGEILEIDYLTAGGMASVVFMEATPGGAFEPVARMRYDDDPAGFEQALLALLQEHAVLTRDRIDPRAFRVTRSLDQLSGAVTPIVRRGYASLGQGHMALALGDVHATNDPLTGQGANMAVRAAWVLGEALVACARDGGALDEAFCVDVEQRIWESIRPAVEWTNAFLQPPPEHVVSLLVEAAQNQALADTFVDNFNYPERQWAALSSPAATDAFLASFEKWV